jgi:Cu+-exporting ATPase
MKNVNLKVAGMNCANCALGLEKHLEKFGAHEVHVSFTTSRASFKLDETGSLDKIKKEIERLGYQIFDGSLPIEKYKKFSPGLFLGKALSTIEGKFYFSLIWTIPLFLHMFLPLAILHDPFVQLILCIPVYAVGLLHFGKSALSSLKMRAINMDILIVIGISAAFVYSLAGIILKLGPDYLFFETTATITTVVLLGNVIERRSVKKTTSAIEELTRFQARDAKLVTQAAGREKVSDVPAEQIQVGDILLVNSGDKVPADGEIIRGSASIDESAISGESLAVDKEAGDLVVGGTLVLSGSIYVKAVRVGEETVLGNIIRLVSEAHSNKPRIQRMGDKVSAYFVPIVLGFALITLIFSVLILGITFQEALLRSIAVLVIACPCAMGLATPTAVMVGVSRGARNGILLKGGSTIEEFSAVRTIIFDKTGTLTTGQFKIKQIRLYGGQDLAQVRSAVYSLEKHSSHPLARSLTRELSDANEVLLENVKESKGISVKGEAPDGSTYEIGSQKIAQRWATQYQHDLYLLRDEELVAGIDITDDIKVDAAQTISDLKAQGIRTVLLSGDKKEKCLQVAQQVGINEVYYEKLPEEKLKIVEKITREGPSAFIGDGINDAPSLARATVGISLTEATEAAIQSARIVILSDRLAHLASSHALSKRSLLTIKQNLFWAFFYNTAAIPLAAAGYLSPMIAALAMAFSDLMVIGNSLRLRKLKIPYISH